MKQYVTIDKRSKKAQKEYYSKQRLTFDYKGNFFGGTSMSRGYGYLRATCHMTSGLLLECYFAIKHEISQKVKNELIFCEKRCIICVKSNMLIVK